MLHEIATRTILLVEDDKQVAAAIEGILSLDYRVVISHSLFDARTAMQGKCRPDLILADVGLTDGLGSELVAYEPETPVILMSGRWIPGNGDACHLLEKPFSPEVLLAAIRFRLRQRERSAHRTHRDVRDAVAAFVSDSLQAAAQLPRLTLVK